MEEVEETRAFKEYFEGDVITLEEYVITSREREKLTEKRIKEIENYNKKLRKIKRDIINE